MLSPPTRLMRMQFQVINVNMQALLVANAAAIYTTSGIYSVEAYYDVFTLKLFTET